MLDPRNTYKIKFWTHEKYPREKISDPRNTHENKSWTHEIPTRKDFEPTKARWQHSTRPTMAQDPWNLAHSVIFLRASIVHANKTHKN